MLYSIYQCIDWKMYLKKKSLKENPPSFQDYIVHVLTMGCLQQNNSLNSKVEVCKLYQVLMKEFF